MIEQYTENSVQDNNGNSEQESNQNHEELRQIPNLEEMLHMVIQLSEQIKELDKKNTRIEELISSTKNEIKMHKQQLKPIIKSHRSVQL